MQEEQGWEIGGLAQMYVPVTEMQLEPRASAL